MYVCIKYSDIGFGSFVYSFFCLVSVCALGAWCLGVWRALLTPVVFYCVVGTVSSAGFVP